MGLDVVRGEWAIVGGTGEFSMATGAIYKKFHKKTSEGDIVELTIHGFCPVLQGSKQVRPTNTVQYFSDLFVTFLDHCY